MPIVHEIEVELKVFVSMIPRQPRGRRMDAPDHGRLSERQGRLPLTARSHAANSSRGTALREPFAGSCCHPPSSTGAFSSKAQCGRMRRLVNFASWKANPSACVERSPDATVSLADCLAAASRRRPGARKLNFKSAWPSCRVQMECQLCGGRGVLSPYPMRARARRHGHTSSPRRRSIS